jgi:hypothetical protein
VLAFGELSASPTSLRTRRGMCPTDVHGDVDIDTVGDEAVEHRAIGRRDRFGSVAALGRACERRRVGRGSSAGPSMSQLAEVPQQDDGAARDQQDHGIQRQELSII